MLMAKKTDDDDADGRDGDTMMTRHWHLNEHAPLRVRCGSNVRDVPYVQAETFTCVFWRLKLKSLVVPTGPL